MKRPSPYSNSIDKTSFSSVSTNYCLNLGKISSSVVRFLDHGKDMTPFDGNAIDETGLDTGNSTLDTKSENRRS